ncbi:MAG: response regulator transcription factor [Lewinellaceae bacterium]|nr:response regulator transcription factor [Lewinellaceae bacterium]
MNETLRCLIVEDELLPAELLSDYIRQTPWLALAGVCTDAIFAMEWLRRDPVDVIFLDIHLPQLKGLDFLAVLQNPPLVVLTTAYHEYALQSYRFDVVDYLLKPYDFPRFIEAAEKLHRRHTLHYPAPDAIFVKVNKLQVRILLQDILYIESLKEYCKIHIADRSWLTQATLTEMEARLPPDLFLRIHRSYIIHLNQMTAYAATEIELGKFRCRLGRHTCLKYRSI